MGESQILAHSRKTGVKYFWNTAQKSLRKFFFVMSLKYYLKWLNILKGHIFGGENSHRTAK